MINLVYSYNTPLWTWEAPVWTTSADYSINWFSLCDNWISIKNLKFWAINEINSFNRPLVAWRWLLSSFRRWRSISFTVIIKWDTVEDFVKKLDAFRKAVYTEEAYFDRKVWWKIRRIKVNCKTAPVNFEHYNTNWGKFDVTLDSLEESEYEVWYESKFFEQRTQSFREEITNKWTDITYPLVYFFFKTASWVNDVKLKVWDREIEVNEAISDWDTLIFNNDEMLTTLNWTEVEWDWDIPFLENWSNFVDFTINWTFEVDILVLYKTKYV